MFASVLVSTLAFNAAAQSPELREKVRIHDSSVISAARAELDACTRINCADTESLSLLLGYLVLSEGNPHAAALQLLAQSAPAGLVAFHAFYLSEALAYSGETARAQRGFSFVTRRGPPWLTRKAVAREAEMLAKQERWPEVLLRLETLPDSVPPELVLLRAQAELAIGRIQEGQADLRNLLLRTPAHPAAAEAQVWLTAQLPNRPLWNLDEHILRTHRLLEGGAAASALAELDAVAQEKVARGAPVQGRLALLRATVLFALGKEPEAQQMLDLAARGPSAVAAEVAMLRARRTMHGPDSAEAHRQMADIATRYRGESFAMEAAFLSGWLDLQRGELAAAARALNAYADQFPHSSFRDDALWFSALALLHLGQPGPARASLQKLQQLFPRSPMVPQARYWSARSLQLQVPAGDARGEYQDILKYFPGNLYALFAGQRLRELGVTPAPAFPAPRAPASSEPLPRNLVLASTLARTGLQRDAAEELQAQTAATRGAEALPMAQSLQRLGEYGQAYSLAQRALWGQGFGERKPEALAIFFPRPFTSTVESAGTTNRVQPFFIWSIMRQESGYQPDRISAANARGLMQLIPPTARAIAEQLKEPPPAPDALYAPALNVELAGWYLGKLWERFDHPALVAAAYNAGPSAVLRWTGARGGEALDFFVEDIPYKETRGYVKQVLADYFNYFEMYGKPADRPAWTWELPKPKEQGVSF